MHPQPGEHGNDFKKYPADKQHAILFNKIADVRDALPRHGPIELKETNKLTVRVVHEQFRQGDLLIPIAKWEASITVEFQQWDGKASNTLDFTNGPADLKK